MSMNARGLAGFAALACFAATAQAELLVYSANPHYSWLPTALGGFSQVFPGMQFDPLQAVQNGSATPTSIDQWYQDPSTSSSLTELYWRTGPNVRIGVTPVFDFAGFVRPPSSQSDSITSYNRPTDYSGQAAVGPGSGSFSSSVIAGWGRGFSGFGIDYLRYVDPATSWATYQVSLPSSMVIGLELTIAGQTHYGWALVHHTGFYVNRQDGAWQVERWAYETTPNTPAVIPAPGAGALLGVAGVIASRRRRK
ncbi:hypothetical protein [Nostoc sp. CHAB 5715]|uniref:hypothetical protein n=1 Tax=Nostoc sp. CHAB 5715 TaxID=2780400 RepID=UPI001E5825C2|nr:hypothetical protein [Nostoc sp. CHAB 5715]MCC5621602.1 hypothetical protein [Nostoc sp. CHAB 5715]